MYTGKAETLLIVDHDRRFRDSQDAGQSVFPVDEAEKIALMACAFAPRMRRIAFVSEHDPDGFQAYHNSGYETIPVNGNRNQVLNARLAGWGEMLANDHRISHLVVVSPDKQFEPLLLKAKQSDSTVHLWASAEKTPQELKRPFYDFRDIDQMFPKSSGIIFYIDYENLHITLERNGFRTDPVKIVNAIKTMAEGLGKVVSLEAYADWGELEKHSQMDIQRKLADLDVNTHYLISHHGKNSADMRIVKDVRDALELMTSRHQSQSIGLVSGDSDFRNLLNDVRQYGKRTLVLGLRESMSAGLVRAADEVRYLDSLLCEPAQNNQNQATSFTPCASQIDLVARVKKAMSNCQSEEMDIQSLLEKSNINARELARAIEQDVFLMNESRENGKTFQSVSLNKQHPVVCALEYLAQWVPDRITYALLKGLPWVDSNYLAHGMKADGQLQQWNIGQDRRDADKWLAAIELMGCVNKKLQAHPNTPEHKITTWSVSNPQVV